MLRTVITTVIATSLLAVSPTRAKANDIVDFLRAISGPRVGHHAPHGPPQPASHHRHGYQSSHRSPYIPAGSISAAEHYSRERLSPRRPNGLQPYRASGSQFTVSLGTNSSPYAGNLHNGHQNAYPQLPPPPSPGTFDHLPHQLGSFVTCPVALETCVQVRDTCRIAPNAVPVVVAIRDPHLGRYRKCIEQLAYVEVYVPPCPVQRVKVSPCRTRIRLDYGRYAVNIVSRNGVVTISYVN